MTASDLDLLGQYARQNSEAAFAALVRRHLNLVYSAALRQVRAPQLAEEVAQSVFADLARQAGQLQPGTILTAWLYQVARRTAIDVVRRESRRQARERLAVEMAAMNSNAPDWTHIEPLLDEAMDALDPADRAAVLLRYFENQSLREVGQALGTTDDAAQKRVSRAVERLREFFAKRGVAVGAGGLAIAISAHAVQAAPVGLAATISAAAALAGTTIATTATVTATKAIAMTMLHKTLIAATLAVSVGTGIYGARRVARLQDQVKTLQQQQAPLVEQVRQLRRERDEATNRFTAVEQENALLRSETADLPRLRGEVTLLRAEARAMTQPKTADTNTAETAANALLAKVNLLKQKLEQTPGAKIPELQFLTDADWVNAASGNLDTEAGLRKVFSILRNAAERTCLINMQTALHKYIQANNQQFPSDLSQLKPYFETVPGDDILQRYKIVSGDSVPAELNGGDSIITQKAVIDEENDAQYTLGRSGLGAATYQYAQAYKILAPAIQALTAAGPTNDTGQQRFDISQLLPYLTTPEQKAAYQKLTHQAGADSK